MNRSRRRGGRGQRPHPQVLLASSDEQLVDMVLDGDDAAFEVLFDRHVADAVWLARDVLGSWGDAEEAVRHSFAAARAYLASRDRDIEFGPWLHTILGNHCLSMLQARGPRPGAKAAVIDLDEWRRRRKRLGIAAPVVPGAALHQSVMAACGIGTGATASAPLLGGTLAKVAVVALLAGGVGVAEQATFEHDRPADVAQVSRTEQVATTGAHGGPAQTVPVGRSVEAESRLRPSRDGRAGAGGRSAPRRSAPRAESPAADSPTTDAPAASTEPATSAPPTPSGGHAPPPAADAVDGAAGAVAPVHTTLQRVREVVSPSVPPGPTGALPEVRLPAPVDLSKIGDDLQVTTGKLTADVHSLLSRGTSAPPQ